MTLSLSDVASVEALRALGLVVLREGMSRLSCGRVHFPALRGEMQAHEGMPFHLVPELFLQLEGETRFTFPERGECVVGPGEVCVVPAGLPHAERVRGLAAPFANLVFLPSRAFPFHLARELRLGTPGGVVGDWLPEASESCAILLREAARLWHNGHSEGPEGALGALRAVFARLLGALETRQGAVVDEPFKVMQARQQIVQHLHESDLSVASLAARLHCTPGHLSRLFRQSAGVSLQHYLMEQRLTRSAELLLATPMNISEVAHAAGFRDPAYFARAFRGWAGCTPRVYRHRAR